MLKFESKRKRKKEGIKKINGWDEREKEERKQQAKTGHI